MSDEELREAERAWRANEADQAALARWIAARYRAGLPVGLELLERRVHPARCFDLPVPARFWTEDPQGERVDLGETPAGGEGLAVPPLGWLWARPDDALAPEALPALLGAEPDGLELDLRSDGEPEAVVRCLAGSLLTALRLRCDAPLSAAALAALAALPRLVRLGYECATGAVTREDLACLARLPNLSALELELRSELAPGALTSLAGARALLELSVTARGRRLDEARAPGDEELAAMVRGLSSLRTLDLEQSERALTDGCLRALVDSCSCLRSLLLPNAAVSDDGVRVLCGLPLRALRLSSDLVTDACADDLARLPLTRLELWTRLTCVGLSRLPTTLTDLVIRVRPQSGGLSWLGRLKALRSLSLFLARDVSDEELGHLGGLERLDSLQLGLKQGGRVTWRGLLSLGACSGLSSLTLHEVRRWTVRSRYCGVSP